MKNEDTGGYDAKEKGVTGTNRNDLLNNNQKIYTGSANHRRISFNNSEFMPIKQCLNNKCQSDYTKYNVRGYCQNCVQQLEFYKHERPQMFAKIVASLQGVAV